MGAAYGTAKSGCGISAMAVMKPEFIMKSVIPVVMAGIIAIYGLVVAVLIAGNIDKDQYSANGSESDQNEAYARSNIENKNVPIIKSNYIGGF